MTLETLSPTTPVTADVLTLRIPLFLETYPVVITVVTKQTNESVSI